jgi:tRNA nucleotidyltransferase (CCA-adding enzyme)
MTLEIVNFLSKIASITPQDNIVVVGGAIRDFLMKSSSWCVDIDLMTDTCAETIANKCQSVLGGNVIKHEKFGTAKLKLHTSVASVSEIDFAQARTESYKQSGALPDVQFTTIDKDLFRRDFTINAMAVKLPDFIDAIQTNQLTKDYIIDPTFGYGDLNNKLVRIIHQKSFEDDPTRMFRAIRYLNRYQFSFEKNTFDAFTDSISNNQLLNISSYRVWQEIKKILEEDSYVESLSCVVKYKMKHPFFDGYLEESIKSLENCDKKDRQSKFLAQGCRAHQNSHDKFLSSISLSKDSKNEVLKWL